MLKGDRANALAGRPTARTAPLLADALVPAPLASHSRRCATREVAARAVPQAGRLAALDAQSETTTPLPAGQD